MNILPNERHLAIPDHRYLAIVDAVCYWLGYQFKIGRARLIHEASLRYPIADTLTSHSISMDQIVLEKLHPLFKSKKIDLVITNNRNSDDIASIDEVYEFKLAKHETAVDKGEEHQRVFDDIVRLAYFNLWANKNCFFLMCGKYEDFLAYFVGQSSSPQPSDDRQKYIVPPKNNSSVNQSNWSPNGIYKDWFRFEINESIEKTFDDTDAAFGLRKFQENYKIRNMNHKFKKNICVKTTCMAITPFGGGNRTHAAGIWKIEGIST